MSKHFGFLVLSRRTGYLAEGKNHAAKVFESAQSAKQACRPLSDQAPAPIAYAAMAVSLLKGSAFCFENEALHVKFTKCLRNDIANKAFLAYSQDRNFVHWRKTVETVSPPVEHGTKA